MNLSPGGELLTQATRRLGRDDMAGVSVGEWCLIIIGFVIVGLFVDRFTHKSWLCCRWCARCCDTCLNGKPLEPEVPPPPHHPSEATSRSTTRTSTRGGAGTCSSRAEFSRTRRSAMEGPSLGTRTHTDTKTHRAAGRDVT